jgi:hypothetical protein
VFRTLRFALTPSKPVSDIGLSTSCQFLRFRFFEAEEVKVAALVAGDDELESMG